MPFRYTDEELLEYLRDFKEKHNRIPRASDFKKNKDLPSDVTYRNHFGSWNNALEKVGFSTVVTNRKIYSDEELLEYLRKFYEKHDKKPSHRDFNENPLVPSATTYQKRFGLWNNALVKAGFEIEEEKTAVENLSNILQEYRYSGRFAPRTLATNLPILVDFESFLIEERNKQGFQALELRDMIEYFNHLRTKGAYNVTRETDQKPNSINTMISKAYTIASFLTWDQKVSYKGNHPIVRKEIADEIKEWINTNYSTEHRRKNTENSRTALTEEQIKTIFRKVRHPILRFVFWLGLNFGLRQSEYLRLRLGHIDLVNKRIKIYGKFKGGNHKERILDLSVAQRKRLKREMKRRELYRPYHDYLLVTTQGNKPHKNLIWYSYQKISKIVEFGVTSHDVRYTAAKRWEKAESEDGTKFLISDIQRMLGHANLRVTSDYLRSGEEELTERYNKIMNDNQNE